MGASLACALSTSGKSILVVESKSLDSGTQPSYDERTVALTYSSRNIYADMDIWHRIEAEGVQPILDIHVSSLGHFGQAHLSCAQAGTPALGYVAPVRAIGAVLWEKIRQSPNITLECPSTVTDATSCNTCCQVMVATGSVVRTCSTRLLVVADGGRSTLAGILGFRCNRQPYAQSAILSMVQSDRPHNGRAYERFTPQGPLALLPHHAGSALPGQGFGGQHYAVVWSTADAGVARRLELDDQAFVRELQETFGYRAGAFSLPTPRKAYPLSRMQVRNPVRKRAVLIGNAAHCVHPVAGQGFNLGLRDIAWLAELLREPHRETGDTAMLEAYKRNRSADTRRVARFTHSLVGCFANRSRIVTLGRNLGLFMTEHLPPVKRALLRNTMGLHELPARTGVAQDPAGSRPHP